MGAVIISSIIRLIGRLILLALFSIPLVSVAQTDSDSKESSETPLETLTEILGQESNSPLKLETVDQVVEAIEALPFTSQPLYSAQGVLNFREGVETNSRVLDQIPDGFNALHIVEKQGQRVLVRFCGEEGWVSLDFLRKQNNEEPRKQRCQGKLIDPFPIVTITDEVEDIKIDSTLKVGDNQRIDATELERDLGQATLSPSYSLCLSDAKADTQKLSFCLDLKVVAY